MASDFDDLFKPDPPKGLEHGYVDGGTPATKEEIEAAHVKLAHRRALYGWRVGDSEALNKARALAEDSLTEISAMLARLLDPRRALMETLAATEQLAAQSGSSLSAERAPRPNGAISDDVAAHASGDFGRLARDVVARIRRIVDQIRAESDDVRPLPGPTAKSDPGDGEDMQRRAERLQRLAARLHGRIAELESLCDSADKFMAIISAAPSTIAVKPLPFYGDAYLLHLQQETSEASRYALIPAPYGAHALLEPDGKSDWIHHTNGQCGIMINDETIEEYVWFFCEHVHSEAGGFYVCEEELSAEALRDCKSWHDRLTRKAGPGELGIPRQRGPSEVFKVETGGPLVATGPSTDGRAQIIASLIYAGRLFRAIFAVDPDGMIEMTDDHILENLTFEATPPSWRSDRETPDAFDDDGDTLATEH